MAHNGRMRPTVQTLLHFLGKQLQAPGCHDPGSKFRKPFTTVWTSARVYGRLPYFYITGGDPILHPDFWRLLALLKEHDIPFAILGNPFHLTDEVCMRLKGYGCRKYQLSLDGMRETHDWFRKPGSFDCTLEKIGCINRAGIRSVVMTTVSGANISEVPDIIDTVVKAGADVYAFAATALPAAKGHRHDTAGLPAAFGYLLSEISEIRGRRLQDLLQQKRPSLDALRI